MIDFLNKKIRTLEALDRTSKSNQTKPKYHQIHFPSNKSANNLHQSSIPKTHNITKPSTTFKCFFCSGAHSIYTCDYFRKKSVSERLEFIKANKLCFNCLAKHQVNECKSQKTCSFCHLKVHSLLHDSSRSTKSKLQTVCNDEQTSDADHSAALQINSSSRTNSSSISSTSATTLNINTSSCGIVLLGTAIVEV